MMNKIAIAAALTAVATAQYAPPAVVETTAAAAAAPVYYYGDYDNVVIAAKDQIYYASALTPEAIAREKSSASASSWSAPKSLKAAGLYNVKGAVFCGKQYSKDEPQAGKYGQLFVADEGDAENAGRVVGWEVEEDPANPAAVKLKAGSAWDVYAPKGAQPTDVECGPNNGLFIADKGTDAIYWVTGADVQAKKPDAYAEVVPADCGAAVAEVRSLAYDAVNEKLLWTNNDEVNVANSGVFAADQAKTGVEPVACKKAMCDAWSSSCSTEVKKVEDVAMGEKAWAVADAWGGQQVSKGDAKVYNKEDAVIAEAPKEATYAEPAADEKRDVLFVSDAQEGAVYAVANQKNAKLNVVAENLPGAYGVAYNNAWGWAPEEASSSSLLLSVGAAVLALATLF